MTFVAFVGSLLRFGFTRRRPESRADVQIIGPSVRSRWHQQWLSSREPKFVRWKFFTDPAYHPGQLVECKDPFQYNVIDLTHGKVIALRHANWKESHGMGPMQEWIHRNFMRLLTAREPYIKVWDDTFNAYRVETSTRYPLQGKPRRRRSRNKSVSRVRRKRGVKRKSSSSRASRAPARRKALRAARLSRVLRPRSDRRRT